MNVWMNLKFEFRVFLAICRVVTTHAVEVNNSSRSRTCQYLPKLPHENRPKNIPLNMAKMTHMQNK